MPVAGGQVGGDVRVVAGEDRWVTAIRRGEHGRQACAERRGLIEGHREKDGAAEVDVDGVVAVLACVPFDAGAGRRMRGAGVDKHGSPIVVGVVDVISAVVPVALTGVGVGELGREPLPLGCVVVGTCVGLGAFLQEERDECFVGHGRSAPVPFAVPEHYLWLPVVVEVQQVLEVGDGAAVAVQAAAELFDDGYGFAELAGAGDAGQGCESGVCGCCPGVEQVSGVRHGVLLLSDVDSVGEREEHFGEFCCLVGGERGSERVAVPCSGDVDGDAVLSEALHGDHQCVAGVFQVGCADVHGGLLFEGWGDAGVCGDRECEHEQQVDGGDDGECAHGSVLGVDRCECYRFGVHRIEAVCQASDEVGCFVFGEGHALLGAVVVFDPSVYESVRCSYGLDNGVGGVLHGGSCRGVVLGRFGQAAYAAILDEQRSGGVLSRVVASAIAVGNPVGASLTGSRRVAISCLPLTFRASHNTNITKKRLTQKDSNSRVLTGWV